jgi:PhnB protein
MHVLPYLYFDGRCDEALGFYEKALGAQVGMKMRFKESPEPHGPGALPPGVEDNVMHAEFKIGDTTIFASDGIQIGKPTFHGISLTLACDDAAQAERYFAALAEGGQVQQPLIETFFSPRFGMVADRFGVSWAVIAAPAQQ